MPLVSDVLCSCGSEMIDPLVGCVPCLQDFMVQRGFWQAYPQTES